MRNWAIAFAVLALVSGLSCLGSDTRQDLGVARILMVAFGALSVYAATAYRLQSRQRDRSRAEAFEGRRGPLGA